MTAHTITSRPHTDPHLGRRLANTCSCGDFAATGNPEIVREQSERHMAQAAHDWLVGS